MRILLGFTLALLSACGGGGGAGGDGGTTVSGVPAGSEACHYVTGVMPTVTSTCATCTISNPELATDGSLETYATIHIPALSNGRTSLLVTANTSYPGGTKAGGVLGMVGSVQGNTVFNDNFELQTYYQGAPVGTNQGGSPNVVAGAGNQSPSVWEFTSPVMYDGIEVAYTEGVNTNDFDIHLYEFCGGDQ